MNLGKRQEGDFIFRPFKQNATHQEQDDLIQLYSTTALKKHKIQWSLFLEKEK